MTYGNVNYVYYISLVKVMEVHKCSNSIYSSYNCKFVPVDCLYLIPLVLHPASGKPKFSLFPC